MGKIFFMPICSQNDAGIANMTMVVLPVCFVGNGMAEIGGIGPDVVHGRFAHGLYTGLSKVRA